MAVPNRALDTRQAGRFRATMQLLQAGQMQRALDEAEGLAREMPDAADAQQLLGMALSENGQPGRAEQAFQRALSLAPESPVIASNVSAWLLRQGRGEEALAVLAGLPESAPAALQFGLAALQLGEHERARAAFERALRLQPTLAAAWHGLGSALRGLGELEAAEAAFRRNTQLQPEQASAWINLGAVLRLLGRIAEALVCMRHAAALGHAGPELADAINGLLLDAGRPEEALQGARALVSAMPAYVPGLVTLTHLLWEHGEALGEQDDPLAMFVRAAAAQPGHRDMAHGLVRMLLETRRPQQALAALATMRTTFVGDPVLDWFAAEALDALGRHHEAGRLYAGVHRVLEGSSAFLNARTRHAFRIGDHEQAGAYATGAVALAPGDQEAWANLGTAWRLLGDAREEWLLDYDNLIGELEIEPPVRFTDMEAFLAELGTTLNGLHLAGREPISQSVRHGTQTTGRLFGRDDRILGDTERALRTAVERWLARLPLDPAHPLRARRQDSVRFVGSWSVRLKSSGRHSSHIHNEGWLSSAFYVALPASVREPLHGSQAGWIQFGQPLEELGLDLAPRRVIQPVPGRLVVFPSYMWHGTLPFEDPEPRLTIAFDMQPMAVRAAG